MPATARRESITRVDIAFHSFLSPCGPYSARQPAICHSYYYYGGGSYGSNATRAPLPAAAKILVNRRRAETRASRRAPRRLYS